MLYFLMPRFFHARHFYHKIAAPRLFAYVLRYLLTPFSSLRQADFRRHFYAGLFTTDMPLSAGCHTPRATLRQHLRAATLLTPRCYERYCPSRLFIQICRCFTLVVAAADATQLPAEAALPYASSVFSRFAHSR